MRAASALVFAIAGLTGLGALSCGHSAPARYQQRLERTPAPAAHAVHSARLRQLMRGLDRLVSERLPPAMDVRPAQTFREEEIAEIAGALAGSAQQIPSVAASLDLSPEEQRDFVALAGSLARQARELQAQVPRLGPEAVAARVDALRETCAGCHDRFRIKGADDGS